MTVKWILNFCRVLLVNYQTIHADNDFCIVYDTFDDFIDFLNFIIDNMIHADRGSIGFRREPQLTAKFIIVC